MKHKAGNSWQHSLATLLIILFIFYYIIRGQNERFFTRLSRLLYFFLDLLMHIIDQRVNIHVCLRIMRKHRMQ